MSQHFGLDIDLQPGASTSTSFQIIFADRFQLDRLESFIRLHKGGDVDLELVEGRVAIPDGKRVLDNPNAIQNGILQG